MKSIILIVKHIKKRAVLRKATRRLGGQELRLSRRAFRQEMIRREKSIIAQGLIRSWDLREIPYPTREEYENVRFFSKGLTLEYLRNLQKQLWT